MKERANLLLKRLDAWVGRPLIILLGIAAWLRHSADFDRRHFSALAERLRNGHMPRVVFTLLKSAAIGDTVLLSGVVRDLRIRYPESFIRIACGRSNEEAAALIADIDDIVTLPMSSPLGIWRALPAIRADVLLDFDSWPRINAIVAALSGAPITIGFRTSGQHRHYAYTLAVDHDPALHEIDNYRRLVCALADTFGDTTPWVASEPALRTTAGAGVSRVQVGGSAVLHLHAGGSQAHIKEWELDHWRALVEHLGSRGLRVVLSGGLDDRIPNELFRLSLRTPHMAELMPAGPLADLLTYLASARLVVSVDTGVAHLAAATGAPTIVLYGPTSPLRWGARGPQAHYLHDGQAPWINLGFERSATGRPMHVDLAQVIALANRLLNEAPEPSVVSLSEWHSPN